MVMKDTRNEESVYDNFGSSSFAIPTVVAVVVALIIFRSRRPAEISSSSTTTTTTSSSLVENSNPQISLNVPFIFLQDSSAWSRSSSYSDNSLVEQTLRSTVLGYKRESSNALTALSIMLDSALVSEADRGYHEDDDDDDDDDDDCVNNNDQQKLVSPLLLSTKIQQRIQRTAECIEHDEHILAKLLGDFAYVLALPDTATTPVAATTTDNSIRKKEGIQHNDIDISIIRKKQRRRRQKQKQSTHFRLSDPITGNNHNNNMRILNESETHSYDSANQIWAHLTRDWTIEGRQIRKKLYNWCYDQLTLYCCPTFPRKKKNVNVDDHHHDKINNKSVSSSPTILVPGAGLGRLAYDLYRKGGYHVEANEISPSMAAVASSVLRMMNHTTEASSSSSSSFHPYALDPMSNEVDSQRRFDSVTFPDRQPYTNQHDNGSLSYTVGDFVGRDDEDYYQRERVGQFDAVVTCFFIDTATNFYEYVDTIKTLLKPEIGLWVNVGPVQWHHNAILRPSIDEIKDILLMYGWSLLVWSVDDMPVPYRNDHGRTRITTSYDGYRPLRFVARVSNSI